MGERFLGIDLGTQGARAVVVSAGGAVLGEGKATLPPSPPTPPNHHEQDPHAWWAAIVAACRAALQAAGPGAVAGLSISSTSGTVVALDEHDEPLAPALMYNDARARDEAKQAAAAGGAVTARLGYAFTATFGLPKVLWLRRQLYAARIRRFVHPADYLVGRFSGQHGLSDWSNALKTGYDAAREGWPNYIAETLGVPLGLLPTVARPGTVIAAVNAAAAAATLVPAGTPIVAGLTDGMAGFVASGAAAPGDANSTLGTTVVLKALAPRLIADPLGRFYCHRHPDGGWVPGGASNVGGECLEQRFAGRDFAALDAACGAAPTGLFCYPLARRGERLPLVNPALAGVFPDVADEQARFLACLEGVAFVERWAYEELAALGLPYPTRVLTTGGGSRSDRWCQLRADVLGVPVARPARADAAFGMAVLAAGARLGLAAASAQLVRVEHTFAPAPASPYPAAYAVFRRECRQRGIGA